MKFGKVFTAAAMLAALLAGAANAAQARGIMLRLETAGGANRLPITCPGMLRFQGSISSREPGLVQYRILRSDGRLSQVISLHFNRPGNRPIQSQQPINGSERGWQQIQVLYPIEITSAKAYYDVVCRRNAPRPPSPLPPAPRPPEARPPAPAPDPPVAGPDCVSFRPARLRVQKRGQAFYLMDGAHQVAYFGRKAAEARRALTVIRHYRMNQLCFVDRPGPSFKYLLSSGRAPSGYLAGEDCLSFNPLRLKVKKIGGSYKIVDGGHYLFDFGVNRNAARQALAEIRRHGFTRSCFVGRPGPSFTYLRR